MLTRTLIAAIALILAVLVAAVPEGAAQRTRTDIDSGLNTLLLGRTTANQLVTDGTINTGGFAANVVMTAGAVTGIILQKGIRPGQIITVVHKGTGTITFAASGTSNVAYGTSAIIQSLAAAMFVWDDASSLWHPLNP